MRKIWQSIRNSVGIYLEIDGDLRAASFAFYAFFSLFPIILLTVSVGSRFVDPESVSHTIIEYINSVIPLDGQDAAEVIQVIEGVMSARTSLDVLAVIGVLWSSNHFFRALVRGVNRAWHVSELDWWKVPLKNFAMLGIFASALLVGVIAPVIISTIDRFTPFDFDQLPGYSILIRYGLPSLVLFYGLVMLYKLSPRRKVQFREVWLGALLVTVALKLLQQLLLYYTNNIWQVNALYGAMGVLVVLLLWVYLCGVIIIYGGCLTAAMHGVVPYNRKH